MRKILAGFFVFLLVMAVTYILAEQNKERKQQEAQMMEMPKPGPELNKLDFLVGNWMAEVTMYPSDFGPGGQSQGKEAIEWVLDGMFISMDYLDLPADKKMSAYKGKGMMTYDTQKKSYRSWWMDNWGSASESVGDWTDEKTLVLSHQQEFMGQKFHEKFIYKILDQNKFHFQIDHSKDGKEFKKAMEATYTKEK